LILSFVSVLPAAALLLLLLLLLVLWLLVDVNALELVLPRFRGDLLRGGGGSIIFSADNNISENVEDKYFPKIEIYTTDIFL
jgi:hypothetical protein